MTTAAGLTLDRLAVEHPEWRAWTALLRATIGELARPEWERPVPALADSRPADAPLLAGAVLEVDRGLADRWIGELFRAAAEVGAPGVPAEPRRVEALDLMEAAIAHDGARLHGLAGTLGLEPAALRALAPLVATPLLQACQRRLASAVPETWSGGHCPVCGAWPALAEARGLERARRLRCSRCAADWPILWLECPYCGERHHDKLRSLVSETHGDTRKVDVCLVCRGYLKTRTTLRPASGRELLLEDLATVELDLAAVEHGYRRPEPPAFALGLRLIEPRRRGATLFGPRR